MADPPVDLLRLALGQGHLDRRAEVRRGSWDDVPSTRRVVHIDQEGNVALEPSAVGGPRPAPVLARSLPDPPRSERGESPDLFLGVDSTGTALVGRVVEGRGDDRDVGAAWASLRAIGLRLSEEERAIVVELVALSNWHRTHRHCPRCGAPTRVAGLGWWRTCPQDGTEHYPRTDPAVIALLIDDDDNALLGRQTRWPQGAFSTLAGFVEPGESAEAAVDREIHEEVDLHVTSTHYLGSQPWPFPASLMLGFHARVPGVRPEPHPDGDEIAEARWLSRDELPALARSHTVRLPGRLSIAHHLIGRWFGAPLPDEWCRW